MSIYKTEYEKPKEAWEQFTLMMQDYAESCYLRWINCDEDLSENEVNIAVSYQKRIEADDGDFIEIEIPPDIDVSPEEFEAFKRVALKLQKAGIGSIINAMIGNANPYLRGQDNTWENIL